MTSNRHNGIFYGVDGWTVLLYVLIVAAGWISITSASYDDSAADLLSFSHFYMKQLMWIGMAWVTAIIVLLLDERFYHMFAYPAYLGGIALLVAALLFGREVNGAKAWFEFGSLRVQPVEFAKIATALALAREGVRHRVIGPDTLRRQCVQANDKIPQIGQRHVPLFQNVHQVKIRFRRVRHHHAKGKPVITTVIHHHNTHQR